MIWNLNNRVKKFRKLSLLGKKIFGKLLSTFMYTRITPQNKKKHIIKWFSLWNIYSNGSEKWKMGKIYCVTVPLRRLLCVVFAVLQILCRLIHTIQIKIYWYLLRPPVLCEPHMYYFYKIVLTKCVLTLSGLFSPHSKGGHWAALTVSLLSTYSSNVKQICEMIAYLSAHPCGYLSVGNGG